MFSLNWTILREHICDHIFAPTPTSFLAEFDHSKNLVVTIFTKIFKYGGVFEENPILWI